MKSKCINNLISYNAILTNFKTGIINNKLDKNICNIALMYIAKDLEISNPIFL